VSAEGGFSLLELLTVLALVSVLMGIGVGAFRRINLGRAMAVSQVKDSLRSTRLFAVEQGAPSRLDFNLEEGVMISSGMVGVGNWHFEDSTGWPTTVETTGDATFEAGGVLGRCLVIPEGSVGLARLGRSPSFDGEQGFRAELFVRTHGERTATILEKGDAFRIQVSSGGGIRAEVRTREGGLRGRGEGEMLSLNVPDCVPRDRWTRVGLSYDGIRLRVMIDGRDRAELKNDERMDPWPDPLSPLVAGSIDPPFVGSIDEVRLAAVETAESPPLPDGVVFKKAATVWFDGRGRLDPARHAEPVVITLQYGEESEGRVRDVLVGLMGEVQ